MSSGLEERIATAESLLREMCTEISVLDTRAEILLKRVGELEARSSPQEVEISCMKSQKHNYIFSRLGSISRFILE